MEKLEQERFLKAFGRRLAELRQAKGLSYRRMAQKCSLDHSDISRYEKGETNLTLLTILELSKALDIHPGSLIEFSW